MQYVHYIGGTRHTNVVGAPSTDVSHLAQDTCLAVEFTRVLQPHGCSSCWHVYWLPVIHCPKVQWSEHYVCYHWLHSVEIATCAPLRSRHTSCPEERCSCLQRHPGIDCVAPTASGLVAALLHRVRSRPTSVLQYKGTALHCGQRVRIPGVCATGTSYL